MNKSEWRECLPLLAALNIHTLHRRVEVVRREEVSIAIQELGLPAVSLPNERLIEANPTETALVDAGITMDMIRLKTADFLKRLGDEARRRKANDAERAILTDRMSKTADRGEVEILRERIIGGIYPRIRPRSESENKT